MIGIFHWWTAQMNGCGNSIIWRYQFWKNRIHNATNLLLTRKPPKMIKMGPIFWVFAKMGKNQWNEKRIASLRWSFIMTSLNCFDEFIFVFFKFCLFMTFVCDCEVKPVEMVGVNVRYWWLFGAWSNWLLKTHHVSEIRGFNSTQLITFCFQLIFGAFLLCQLCGFLAVFPNIQNYHFFPFKPNISFFIILLLFRVVF